MNILNFLNPFSRLKFLPFSLIILLKLIRNFFKTKSYAQQCGVVFILIWTLPAAMAMTPPGNALSFSGSNHVQTNEVNLGTSNFTFEGWVKPNGTANSAIYNNRTSETGTAGNWFTLFLANNNKLQIELAEGGVGGFAAPIGNISLTTGVWHHIAVVKDATYVTFYVDGVLDAQIADSYTRNLTGLGAMTIGVKDGGYSHFNGQIDEFRVWKTALSQAQIQTNMHNPLVGNELNLEAYYDFDQTSGTILPDLTGHGHNGTLISSPSWQASEAMPPFPISASDVTPTGFTANWNAVTGATGYRIDVSTDPGFGSFLLQDIAAGSGTSFNVTGLTLTANTTYYFRMRVEKSSWTSPNSTNVSFLLPPGNALSLNGTNNFISTTSQYTNPIGITLEAWFNTTTTQGGEIIGFADFQTVCTSACDRFIWMSNDGYIHFGIWLGYIKKIDSTQSYNDGKWHHVAASLSTTGMMLYVDGALIASDTTANTTQNYSGYWNIGLGNGWGSGPTSSSYFGGKIDEVRIWNVVRDQTQIQSNMYHTLVGNESGLIAYYNFDQTSGTTVPDVSGHGNTGTVQGTATWTTSEAMPPFPISASNVTATGFTANWNAVSGATGYQIDVSTDPNFGSFLVQDIAAGSGTSFTVTGLSLATGTTYYFRMRSEKNGWTSPNSASVSFLRSPGNSLLFATNQRVNCGTGASLKPTTAFTVEAWVKPTTNTQSGYGGAGIIASDSDNDASAGMTGTYFSVRNGLYGAVRTPSGKRELTGNPVPLVWQHVAMVFNGTSLTLYQDGVVTASTTFSATTITPSTNPFFIAGSGLNNSWYNFQGQIDEVRVWNVARTQTEIQSNLYHTLAGNETGLVAYYNFDRASGTTLPDLAGGDNNGSLVGSPTWTAAAWNYGFPYVTTGSAASTAPTAASVSGTLVDGGLSAVTASGVCYATTPNPTTSSSCTNSGFPATLTGLTSNTVYYTRAYATNSYGTSYGNDVMTAPGNVLQFNGSSQYADCGTGLNPSEFTVEAWVKINSLSTQSAIVSKINSDLGYFFKNLELSVMTSGKVQFMVPNGTTWLNLISTTALTTGTWYHIAGTFGSGVAKIYINGIPETNTLSTSYANVDNSDTKFTIGSRPQGRGFLFNGQMDEVRVWNSARTVTDIQTLMYHTLVGNESGLLAYYNFDQATNSTPLHNSVSNNNHCTLINGPTPTAATWNYGFPYVTTGTASAIHGTTASVGGTIIDPGLSAITASGICYDIAATPLTTPCTTDGATAATFTSNLIGLTPNGITYYARAYATNAYGTNYGTDFSPDITFVTHYLPVIAETSPLSISMSQDGSPVAWVPPTVTASDQDGDTLTWSVNTQATHGTATVSGTGASPTTFTYVPNAGFTGTDSFIVQVADVDGIATITVNVSIGAAFPMVTSTPLFGQTIKFDTLVGTTQIQTITFKNTGERSLFFNGINTPVAPFSYPKPMPFTFIPWGGTPLTTQTLELSCTPTVAGLQIMTLQITTNDPYNPTLNYPLECLGRQPIAQSSVANNTPLNFGSAVINSTLSQSITFTETGNTDLIINSATITGANAANFKITSPTTFPVSIADGSNISQAMTVTCTPTTAIALTATLQITTNDPLNATLTYPLLCSGQYSLTLSTSGQGTINGCGSSCTQNHPQDATVTLSATPATGWQFSSWGGDCVNGQVVMNGNKSCSANFTQTVTNPTNPGTGTTPPPGGTGSTGGSTTPPTNNGGTSTGGSTTPPPSSGGTTTPNGSTTSGSTDLNNSVVAVVPSNNATVDTAMSNYNQTVTNLTVLPNGSVSGGTLAGEVTNQGLIANVTIAANSTLTGGKLSGFNTNSGLLSDVTISQYSQVQGGNYAGNILNNGTLNSPILSPTSAITNNGVIENPVILPGANISGGTLVGTIIVLGTFDSVSIPPTATIITQVSAIPTAIFRQVTAQTLALLPPSVISQITPEQFAEIPVSSLSGLTAQNMAAVSPQVVQSLDAEQIAALKPEEFKAMPGDGVAKFLTNFDTAAITPQEAEKLLPARWTIDQYGNLTAPPGTEIAFKVLDHSQLPAGLILPNIADLNSSFALGGKGSHSLLSQLNLGIEKNGSSVTQQTSGVIKAEVAGSMGYGRKSHFAFMIDPEHIFILDEAALRGLQINEQGQYIIVTEDGKQIPITPMTKDPEALLAVLGENSEVHIQSTGEVFIKHSPISRARDSEIVNSVGIFDPFIEPAPEDICQEDANGEMQCDWSKADADQQPGLRTARNLRAQSAAKVTYPDGSSQKIYPAVLFPDIFVAEAQKFAGVEKAIYRMDGIIAVTYQGMKLWLIPTFDVQVQPIPAGKKFPPSLTLQKGALIYQVPYGDNLITTQLAIIEAPVSR